MRAWTDGDGHVERPRALDWVETTVYLILLAVLLYGLARPEWLS